MSHATHPGCKKVASGQEQKRPRWNRNGRPKASACTASVDGNNHNSGCKTYSLLFHSDLLSSWVLLFTVIEISLLLKNNMCTNFAIAS